MLSRQVKQDEGGGIALYFCYNGGLSIFLLSPRSRFDIGSPLLTLNMGGM